MKRLNKERFFIQWSLLLLFTARPLLCQDIQWLTPKLMDLGRVQQGTIIKDTIRFVNTSEETITIDKVQSGCGCTVTKIDEREIAPGDTGYVGFTLKTKGFRGMVRKTMRITFKELPEYIRLIILNVNAFTNIDFEPPFLFLNNVIFITDSTYHLAFQVKNNSDHAIQLSRIYTHDSSLVVLPSELFLGTGAEDSIRIEFKPRDNARMYLPIMIETDDSVQKTVTYRFHVRFKDAN